MSNAVSSTYERPRWVQPLVLSFAWTLQLVTYAAEVDVYILTGQSNSLGTTALEGDGAQYAPGDHAADTQTRFLWSNVKTSSSDPSNVALIGDSGGQITTLAMQQGEGINPHFWGPEFGLARALFDAGESDLMVIKASRGGGGNTFWIPGPHHMYQHLLETVDGALGQLTERGDDFTVRGLIYLQGESNNPSEAAAADTRLTRLIDGLRAHLDNHYAGAATGMRTVIGEIAASGSNANRVTTTDLQRALAARDPNIAFVGTSDLPLKADNIHFGRDGKLAIGQRVAAAMQGKLVNAASFSTITGHAGATNLFFEDYVPDGNGATDGPNLIHQGTFTGLVEGLNGQPPAGVRIEGSAERVVFADYEPARTYSVLVGGDFDFATSELPDDFQDSGKTITLTFVDPNDVNHKATVSGVGFRLWSTAGDNVRATFLDIDGNVLHETLALGGDNPLGGHGFQAIDSFGGQELAIIHQVVLSSNTGTLWGMGDVDGLRRGAPPIPDFSYVGLTVVPEPTSCRLAIITLVVAILFRCHPAGDQGEATHRWSRTALIEPRACMASLIHVDHERGDETGRRLLFSNPNSLEGRQRLTIKASLDQGATWPETQQLLLDSGAGAGYSCMSMIDDKTVGILYEGSQAHMTFQRVPLREIVGD